MVTKERVMSDIKRCWNCKKYYSCSDYIKPAYGCLSCSEHQFAKLTHWIPNYIDLLAVAGFMETIIKTGKEN